MGEHITKIKVGDEVHCLSLDTLAIDTSTLGFGVDGELVVKLGSSVYADVEKGSGIGVKIHPDTQDYLKREPYGLSLKLSTIADDITPIITNKLSFIVNHTDNTLVIDTGYNGKPLTLGTGLKSDDSGKTLCLSLGSGLEFDGINESIRLAVHDNNDILVLSDGKLVFGLDRLYQLLEARYNLTKK